MINLLYIVGVWGNGGIEKVVYTYCKNLSPDKYNIYLLPIEKRESIFTAKLQEIGDKGFRRSNITNIEGLEISE